MFLSLIITLLLALLLAGPNPAQAQEETGGPSLTDSLEAFLAQSAAKSFLITLTRPELASTRSFYLSEQVSDAMLTELGQVTGFRITGADWLTPNETYQVQATLQPGNRAITIYTGKHGNRWKVEGLELASHVVANSATGATAPTTPGIQPVAGNGSGKLVFQTQSGGDIYIINADGTGLRRVTHGMDPDLSPDGSKIVFTRWDPQYELFTINVDGTNEQAWFSGKRQMKSATWSADGSKLVFSYQDGGRLEGDLDTYSLSELQERAIKGENPVRIPDNARLSLNEQGQLEVYEPADAYWWLAQVDLANNRYAELGTGTRYSYAPTWHPSDPNRLIFRGEKGVAIYDAQAQVSQPVTTDDRDRGAIAISPDGSKIALTYNQDGNWEIHTMNIDGSNRQRLTKTPLQVVASRHIEGNEVFITPEGFRTMSRAQPEGMPMERWNNAAPAWSPDGSQIAFVTDRTGKWEIWIMNADGTNQRPMFPNGALDGVILNFAGVDERMLSWQ
jgi:Tol biopolymer transport system component